MGNREWAPYPCPSPNAKAKDAFREGKETPHAVCPPPGMEPLQAPKMLETKDIWAGIKRGPESLRALLVKPDTECRSGLPLERHRTV
jgi:hypothetical protein